MYKSIKIEKLNTETEEWEKYFSGYAEVNKASGREYFNAGTNITQNTFNFVTHYMNKLNDIRFNTSQYRIIYESKVFDIINVDDPKERHTKITLVGDCRKV